MCTQKHTNRACILGTINNMHHLHHPILNGTSIDLIHCEQNHATEAKKGGGSLFVHGGAHPFLASGKREREREREREQPLTSIVHMLRGPDTVS